MSGVLAGEARLAGPKRRYVGGGPIDHYYRRGNLEERQYRAGDRFRADYRAAGLSACTVRDPVSCTSRGRGEGLTATERQVAARLRWHVAVAALGIRLAPVLVAVCCEERTAADWVRRPGRYGEVQGMTTLRIALDVLADHYGI